MVGAANAPLCCVHLNLKFCVDALQVSKTYWVLTKGVPNPPAGRIDIPMDETIVKGRSVNPILIFFLLWLLQIFKPRAPPERRLAKAAYLSHHAVVVLVVVVVVVVGIDAI